MNALGLGGSSEHGRTVCGLWMSSQMAILGALINLHIGCIDKFTTWPFVSLISNKPCCPCLMFGAPYYVLGDAILEVGYQK